MDEGKASHRIQHLCQRDLVLHQVVVASTQHSNSDLFHGVVFWRCQTDGGWQHQQVDGGRVQPSGQEGEHFQCRPILSLVGNNSTGASMFGRNKKI